MFPLLLACTASPIDETGTPQEQTCTYDTGEDESALSLEGDPDCGAEIFSTDCTGCHGAAGEGTEQGPELAEHVVSHTDAELLAVLVIGTDTMPPSGLTQQGYADVLSWLRLTFGEYNGTGH